MEAVTFGKRTFVCMLEPHPEGEGIYALAIFFVKNPKAHRALLFAVVSTPIHEFEFAVELRLKLKQMMDFNPFLTPGDFCDFCEAVFRLAHTVHFLNRKSFFHGSISPEREEFLQRMRLGN